MAVMKISALLGTGALSGLMLFQASGSIKFEVGEQVVVAPFDTVAVENGGWITVRPSNTHSVTVVSGDRSVQIERRGSTLKVGCRRPCRDRTPRQISVSMPNVKNVTVNGGGDVRFTDGFPDVNRMSASIRRGGNIDAFNVTAQNVDASITGGGTIQVSANVSLDAKIVSGGKIIYAGDPDVNETVVGGGEVLAR